MFASLAPLGLIAAVYAAGARRLAGRSRRAPRARGHAYFIAGNVVLACSIAGPIHEASEQLFAAHMIQHELMMIIAAPLLIAGQPAAALLWAFPAGVRLAIGRAVRSGWWHRVWSAMSSPLDAFLLHAAVIWAWHVPVAFDAAFNNPVVHGIQHLSFLGSALLFWWSVMHPSTRASRGGAIIALFITTVHTSVLGALITFSRSPWYGVYHGSDAWGLTAVSDQQLAGLIMWIPASMAYLIAALMVLRRWLRDAELTVSRTEEAIAV